MRLAASPAEAACIPRERSRIMAAGISPEGDAVDYRWTCGCCDKQFDTLPLDIGFTAPDHWVGLSEEERQRLGGLTPDICTIKTEEGRQIFIRGCLEIP